MVINLASCTNGELVNTLEPGMAGIALNGEVGKLRS